MQVKKFEAPTMKEALEMVKNQLGPDAIILNAKDNSKGFGLLGRQSIEITAAISEQQLHRKQWAESRLGDGDLSRLKAKPAKEQKQFIEKSVNRYLRAQPAPTPVQASAPAPVAPVRVVDKRPPTQMRYIDIDSSAPAAATVQNTTDNNRHNTYANVANMQTMRAAKGKTVNDVLREIGQNMNFVEGSSSEQRVKSAVKNALEAFELTKETLPPMRPQVVEQRAQVSNQASMNEVQVLKNEIQELKHILQNLSTQKTASTQLFENSVPAELSTVQQRLLQAGIDKDFVDAMIRDAQNELDPAMARKSSFVEGFIAKKMLSNISVRENQSAAKVQIFVGPTGSGKSSHLVKLASQLVIHQNKKVGILTLDTEKVGAVEQLRIYSQILNIPFGILRKPEDWNSVQDAAKNLDYILIDFPANSLKELSEMEKFRRMLPPEHLSCDRHLVLSATFKDSDALEIAERYRIAKPTDLIINKLDEAVTHGLVYNLQRRLNLPLYSFGVGQGLPEDFEYATRERVVDLIFKITKFKNQR